MVYEQSDYARTDGQAVPQELLPLLDNCNKEVNQLKASAEKFLRSTPGLRKWIVAFQSSQGEDQAR